MASKRRNMFHENKKQETTEIGKPRVFRFRVYGFYKVVQTRFTSFQTNLESHSNPLINALFSHTHPLDPPPRLKRRLLRDMLRVKIGGGGCLGPSDIPRGGQCLSVPRKGTRSAPDLLRACPIPSHHINSASTSNKDAGPESLFGKVEEIPKTALDSGPHLKLKHPQRIGRTEKADRNDAGILVAGILFNSLLAHFQSEMELEKLVTATWPVPDQPPRLYRVWLFVWLAYLRLRVQVGGSVPQVIPQVAALILKFRVTCPSGPRRDLFSTGDVLEARHPQATLTVFNLSPTVEIGNEKNVSGHNHYDISKALRSIGVPASLCSVWAGAVGQIAAARVCSIDPIASSSSLYLLLFSLQLPHNSSMSNSARLPPIP
ncbi:hypothetical protein AAG570_009635 [Ranatra chinensis]|uniref:Uncharacterized protein n=1 Tax=Ranatra chinensis TaxID=642074 RepID=A0ABD0YPM3_9HEMI